MPFLDVSDLLLDPDIAGQAFSVIRTVQNAPIGGLAQQTQTTIASLVGSIQPATSTELLRMPDGERVGGAVTIRTPFALTAGGKDGQGVDHSADIVIDSDGTQYTVQSVQSYAAFGTGYVEALASRTTIR